MKSNFQAICRRAHQLAQERQAIYFVYHLGGTAYIASPEHDKTKGTHLATYYPLQQQTPERG